ncbi:MAG: High potential iron-sulfur protein [Pseudoxanthomonas suwonensis]|nr:MAG: High potential iron-sulfur protein [Pseudoxanthomonas suwonensis]
MSEPMHAPSRRRFLSITLMGGAGCVLAAALPARADAAAPVKTRTVRLTRLPVDTPQARALHYTENARTSRHVAYRIGQTCANCQFYQGAQDKAYGPCTLFPRNAVAAKGWCSAWARKAG